MHHVDRYMYVSEFANISRFDFKGALISPRSRSSLFCALQIGYLVISLHRQQHPIQTHAAYSFSLQYLQLSAYICIDRCVCYLPSAPRIQFIHIAEAEFGGCFLEAFAYTLYVPLPRSRVCAIQVQSWT
jgi:hypothetical protein